MTTFFGQGDSDRPEWKRVLDDVRYHTKVALFGGDGVGYHTKVALCGVALLVVMLAVAVCPPFKRWLDRESKKAMKRMAEEYRRKEHPDE